MKRFALLALVLVLCLSAVASLADEGRIAPEDKKVIVLNDVGAETVFRKYDGKFWDAPSPEPGAIVRMDYTTDVYGDTVSNWLNVYLPYQYDESRQYDIIYFFHGTNETPDSFVGDERVKNALDNMIELGVAEPFIMVLPTYYYDYETRATDKELFCEELRQDIMPMVESTYSTYAPTADTEGFIASRNHRAMAGYSQGSAATFAAFAHLLDTARYWLPMSGTSNVETLIAAIDAQSEYKDDFFLYMATGGKRDIAYEGMVPFVKELIAQEDYFSFGNDFGKNNIYATISTEVHQTLLSRYYFYNAFLDGLFR